MAKCIRCGKENQNGAKFCRYCGASLTTEENSDGQKQQGNPYPMAETQTDEGSRGIHFGKPGTGQPLQPKQKKLLIGIGAAAAVIVVALVLFLNRKPVINLNDYVTLTVEGYDGYGTVNAEFDEDRLKEKVADVKIKNESDFARWLEWEADEDDAADAFYVDGFNYSITPESGLKNGDTATLKWDVDESFLSKWFDCKVKYKDMTVKAKGLEKVSTFDPFGDVQPIYDGMSGEATASFENNEYSDISYTVTPDSNLSNGDKITVSIEDAEDNTSNYIDTYDAIPDPSSKEFTVEGLSEYLQSAKDIPDETMNKMKQQTEDNITAEAADWDYATLADKTYVGNYFLTLKDGADSEINWWTGDSMQNEICLVYQLTAHTTGRNDNDEQTEGDDVMYYINTYENLEKLSDGTISVDLQDTSTYDGQFTSAQSIANTWIGTMEITFDHCTDKIDNIRHDIVEENADKYDSEDNIDTNAAQGTASSYLKMAKRNTSRDNAASVQNTDTGSSSGENSVGLTDGQILPNSSSTLLTTADLDGLSASDLKIARNEIYARHGRKFADSEMKNYFESCSWYQGTIDPDTFTQNEKSILNDVEYENARTILGYEKSKGYV